MGQTAAGASEDNNAKSADLLRRARQAMEENNLTAAESLIAQAEALDVQYGPFHFGDTPKKARHDLERKRAAAAPVKPSHLSLPFGLNKGEQAPSADPFAGRQPQSPAATINPAQVTPLPKVDSAGSARSLSTPSSWPGSPAGQMTAAPGENDIRAPGTMPAIPYGVVNANGAAPAAGAVMGLDSRTLTTAGGQTGGPIGASASPTAARPNGKSPLCEARLALAVGDVRRAAALAQQARAIPRNYQPLDDNPDKVDAAIRKYGELQTLDKSTEAYRRAYARNLTEQADALLRWDERDEAERLAGRAASIPIMYGPFEAKPQDLLERIAAVRRSNAGRRSIRSHNGARPGLPRRAGSAAGRGDRKSRRRWASSLVGNAGKGVGTGAARPRSDGGRPVGSRRKFSRAPNDSTCLNRPSPQARTVRTCYGSTCDNSVCAAARAW